MKAIIVLLWRPILLLLCIAALNPWPYYQWAAWRDTIEAYEWALSHFPSDSRAEARLATLKADAEWPALASSRSFQALDEFLRKYPRTDRAKDADARLAALHNDFEWVEKLNTLDGYRRHLAQNPASSKRAQFEKRIIDLEVAAIAASKHDEMPPAQRSGFGSSSDRVEIRIRNDTSYTLTVWYSGPDSRRVVLPQSGAETVTLAPGDYQVAASVTGAAVRNYFGHNSLRAGSYSENFYIRSGSAGGRYLPEQPVGKSTSIPLHSSEPIRLFK